MHTKNIPLLDWDYIMLRKLQSYMLHECLFWIIVETIVPLPASLHLWILFVFIPFLIQFPHLIVLTLEPKHWQIQFYLMTASLCAIALWIIDSWILSKINCSVEFNQEDMWNSCVVHHVPPIQCSQIPGNYQDVYPPMFHEKLCRRIYKSVFTWDVCVIVKIQKFGLLCVFVYTWFTKTPCHIFVREVNNFQVAVPLCRNILKEQN